mgnify:FL=1
MIGKGAAEGMAPQTLARFDHLAIVPAAATGYIQSIDDDGLLALASKADVMLRLRYRPGDFVMSGRGVVEVAPSDHWSKERSGELQECFTVGSKRTPEHDLMFLVSELVEIAARALSPGVNDPMTAVTCLDWLGAGGTEFATREMPKAVRHDAEGKARLIAQPDSFAYFVDQGFGRLRKYAAADVIAALHWLRVVGELAATCRTSVQISLLRQEAELFREQAAASLEGPDARQVDRRAEALLDLLAGGIDAVNAAQIDWLGGSG